jgi:hypothetical protein
MGLERLKGGAHQRKPFTNDFRLGLIVLIGNGAAALGHELLWPDA